MSKKKLDIATITNELRGQSAFFPRKQAEHDAQAKQPPTPRLTVQNKPRPKTSGIMTPRYRDTTIPKHHDTEVPSNHDTVVSPGDDGMIEEVRRAVKQVGKEPATQRLTLEEKQTLRSIEFTYGQQGIITSGNDQRVLAAGRLTGGPGAVPSACRNALT